MKRLPFLSLSLLFILLVMNSSCKDEYGQGNSDNNKIRTGPTVNFSPTTIASGGGSVKLSKPGSPVDGLEISIPPNAYPIDMTFTLAYSEIENHDLGQWFNPISPMITIGCDGGYSDTPMQVTVPITLPAGHFAMAFFYDPETGKLEGLPVLQLTSGSITVTTRHFHSGTDSGTGSLKGRASAPSAAANMIISSIAESTLKNQTIISSGFTPGTDDWEFVNYGSYIAPKGHCAGQSMTAMWYYYEKKLKGESNLFHRFDRVNDKLRPSLLWEDNPRGYRFASTIQKDLNFDGWIDRISLQAYLPGLVFKSFAAAILVTGEPQFVLIRNSDGKGGHAMIVYKVNFNEGKLYIADPNYPNNRVPANGTESIRTINYVGGVLNAYETGLSAGAASLTMDQIGYFGKTAYIEWDRIGQRYKQLEDSTIGHVDPNRFPPTKIWIREPILKELKDGLTTDRDTLRLMVECSTCELAFAVDGKHLIRFAVYDENGLKIDTWQTNGLGYVKLKPGLNKLGIYTFARKTGVTYSNGSPKDLFVDFRWFDVYYSQLKIDPDPITGEPDNEIKVTAKTKGTAPANVRYVWNFGDATPAVTRINDSTATHTYTKEGTFVVEVEMYDNAANKKIAEAAVSALIYKGKSFFEYQGRTYTYKTIGTQTWMTENLAWLPSVDSSNRLSYTAPLYYVYGYEGTNVAAAKGTSNYLTYGVLYNYQSAITACPPGWHLPSDAEWITLVDYLGTDPGGKLKETGTVHWEADNVRATNSSGFTALPGGGVGPAGFALLGSTAYFWSSTLFDATYASRVYLSNSRSDVTRNKGVRSFAQSVRCIKN